MIPPYPSLASVRGASHVSNRYRPRRTSDARFPAPWSLPAAPASPPHTVFSRMKSLSNSFVHVGPARGETTRLSKLGDRSPKREQPGLPGITPDPCAAAWDKDGITGRVKSRLWCLIFQASFLYYRIQVRSLLASKKSRRSAAWQPAIEDKWRRHMLISRSRHSAVQPS